MVWRHRLAWFRTLGFHPKNHGFKSHWRRKNCASFMIEDDYLKISKAADLKSSKDRALFRLFEILPGVFSFGVLIASVILSWRAPISVAVFIIVFDIYWLIRISYLSIHQISSYKQMKKNLKTDWLVKLDRLPGGRWEKIYHLIILPTYKEGLEIIRTTLRSLTESDYPKEKMVVVLATEERAGSEIFNLIKKIENEFSKEFFQFLITIHPKNILGEIAGN